MQFDALRDPDRIARRRTEMEQDWSSRAKERGALIRYVMPALPAICPALHEAILRSSHRQHYLGIYYFVQTNDRHIRQLIPAPEYYKFALHAIADDRYSLDLAQRRLAEVMGQLRANWTLTRETLPRTGQSSFYVADQVYRLKAEVASALFFGRALLDMFATLSHFLYEPESRLFSSFADFVKHISRPDARRPADEDMRHYAKENLHWFWSLRDFRDFVTHYSSMRVDFYQRGDSVETYLQNVVRPEHLVGEIVVGIDAFLHFADNHFAQRFVERSSP